MTVQETILFCIAMGIAIASLVGFIYMRIQIAKDESILGSRSPKNDGWLD
jgi:hypothetical protein